MKLKHWILVTLVPLVVVALLPWGFMNGKPTAPDRVKQDHRSMDHNGSAQRVHSDNVRVAPEESPSPSISAASKAMPAIPKAKEGDNDPRIEQGYRVDSVKRSNVEVIAIAAAIQEYRRIFNEYPTGDSTSISSALLGKNPSKQLFLDWPLNRIGESGELLDPWGKAYVIKIAPESGIDIISSGPDGKFETSDDFAAH